MNFNMNPPTTNTAKYKTMLCKHFETSKGCAFKDKCQFAHGYAELRTPTGFTGSATTPTITKSTTQSTATQDAKKGPNLQNYKIVKCKYWEKDGTCRYGTLCTFAHGDTEVRTKTDNLLLNQGQMGYYDVSGGMGMQGAQGMPGMPGMPYDPNFPQMPMMNPYLMGFDPNLMMGANLGMMGMPQGFDPNMMQMNPLPMGMNPNMMPYPGGQNPSTQGSAGTSSSNNGNSNV